MLEQIHSGLSVRASLVYAEHQVYPRRYVTIVEHLAVLKHKISRTLGPGRQFNVLHSLLQMVKAKIGVLTVYEE